MTSFLERISKEPVQLQLFTPEDEEVITVLESFRSYVLRGPAGITKVRIY